MKLEGGVECGRQAQVSKQKRYPIRNAYLNFQAGGIRLAKGVSD